LPDLSPDLSVYGRIAQGAQQGPLGGLGLGDLMSIARQGRELQTQSAISRALAANPNDPMGAMRQAAQTPGAFVQPGDFTGAAQAAQAQFQVKKAYMGEAAGLMGSLITKPNLTVDDFQNYAPLLHRYGVPDEMIQDIINSVKGPHGLVDHNKLVGIYNWTSGNAALPTRTVTGPGYAKEMPWGTSLYDQTGQGGAAPPPLPQPRPAGANAPPAAQGAAATSPAAAQATNEVTQRYAGYGTIGPGGTVLNPSEAVKSGWEQSSRIYAGENARDYQSEVTPMQKSIELLLQNGPKFTGRGTEEFANVKNFLHTMGIIPDNEMGGVVDFETMRKYMNQFINQSSMGGTDARMWQQMVGSPSPGLLQQTNLNVTRVMLGLRRMQQAALNEFRNQRGPNGQPLPPEYFNEWRNSWAQRQDPMAYVWDTMTREEQKSYLDSHYKGLPKTGGINPALERFRANVNSAQQAMQ